MAVSKRFLPPIPEGHQLFDGFEVSGMQHRLPAAIAFIKGKDHQLKLVREPRNKFDPNAIAVYGISKGLFFGKERHIGYVPAESAARIVASGLLSVLKPRLRNIYLSDRNFALVEMDISGPKTHIKAFRSVEV